MRHLFTLLLLTLSTFALATQVYQWKDANGNTIFSDHPPPGTKAERKNVQANVMDTSGGSYATREALRKAPVTLWINECGEPCNGARNLLNKRGIRYMLRNPEASAADGDALNKVAGARVVPVLQVGTTVLKGFVELDWQAALDNAGYPKSADPTLPGGAKITPPATPPAASPQQPAPK